MKYGYRELRLSLERASARETAGGRGGGGGDSVSGCWVSLGRKSAGYVVSIGNVKADLPATSANAYRARFVAAEESEVRCPDPEASDAMRQHIRQIIIEKDTLGGVFEVVGLGVAAGIGQSCAF